MAAIALIAGITEPHAANGQCDSWGPFLVGANIGVGPGMVLAATVYNGDLIIGGTFTTAGGQLVNRIARWDGSSWQPLGGGMNAQVSALTVFNGELIAGGAFTAAGPAPVNRIARWNGVMWLPLGGGMNNSVTAMTVYNGDLIAAGNFQVVNGQLMNYVARWNGISWLPLSSGTTDVVNALTVYNGELIAGGVFGGAGGQPAARIARWNGAVWQPLGTGVSGMFGAEVVALTVFNGELIAGGSFDTAGGGAANNIARWNGSIWQPLGLGVDNVPYAFSVHNLELITCGTFTMAGGAPANHIAAWTGSLWHPLGSGMNSNVFSLTVHNGDLVAGGQFTMAGGNTVNRIARWVGARWLNPASGIFNVGANWSSGLPPGATCKVQFGLIPSITPYTVTFTAPSTNAECSVRNQRPAFNLGGFQYSIMDELNIGNEQSARLTLLNGSLSSPTIIVGPFGTLTADVPITGNVINRGKLKPGRLGTGGGALLALNGNFIQESTGVLEIEFGDIQNSLMTVNGDAALGGAIRMLLVANGEPPSKQSSPVLTVSGIMSGTFSGALLPFLGPDLVVSLEYVGGAAAMNEGGEANDGATDGGGTNATTGVGGVNITIGTPTGSPNPDDPQSVGLTGEPTGISGLFVGGSPLQVGPAESDLALCIKAVDPEDNGSAVVMLNDGGGATFTPVVVEVGNDPSGIVTAPLADGSEMDDLAVTNKGDNTVSILFHDGSNVYTTITVAVGDAPSAIAAGDVDGDLLMDLAVTNENDNTVTILLNNGDRTFTAQSPVAVGGAPVSIGIDFIMGGTLPDLVVANSSSDTITILENQGGGTYDPVVVTVGSKPIIVTPSDIDNDRDIDILISNNEGGTVAVVRNLGGGILNPPTNLPVDGAPGSMDAWDMDKDGDIDVAVVVFDDTLLEPVIRILRNDSTPSLIAFTLFDPIGSGETPKLVNGSDVSGDTLEDLVSVNVTPAPLAMTSGGSTRRSDSSGPPPDPSMSIRRMLLAPVPACLGDVSPPGTGDGTIGVPDLLFIINHWGPCPTPTNCPADISPPGPPPGNDIVGVPDLLHIINNWGPCD